MIERHHLLECILWPNGDGTFRKIINRAKRLQELGIYDDYKLTIPLDKSTHTTLHREFEKGTEYERAGENAPGYGRTGDKHPMYGRREDRCPAWKGDKVGTEGLYKRQLKRYKAGEITEEEFQPYRDAWIKEQHIKREMKRKAPSL